MKNLNKTTLAFIGIAVVMGILIGWALFGGSKNERLAEHELAAENQADTQWTCSMHPQIRKSEAGDCPICGMELIPLETTDGELDPMAIRMSSTAMQLAQIQTIVVESGIASKAVQLSGKVQADERLLFTQSSHIPGRIEKLTVNFTGDYVSRGQVIAYIYSPDLVTAQQELLEAVKIKETQPELYIAANEKLKNWKLTDNQIEEIANSNKTIEKFPIRANVSGYVTDKMVNLGDYIKQGQPMYEIVDLSRVWILFDVYESELNWIKKGASISYKIQSIPGKSYTGTISYIDPIINPKTRVATARIVANNKDLSLKPEMFVSGTVEHRINSENPTIAVPKSAVMWTGKRSLVYVMQNTSQGISFIMREVVLGTKLGDSYVIESGLQVGEEIAVNGTFSIDAAAQLAGKPSMMNPEGGVAMTGHDHGSTREKSVDNQVEVITGNTAVSQASTISKKAKDALAPLFNSYFAMKTALSGDDFNKARAAGKAMAIALEEINMDLFEGNAHAVWMKQAKALQGGIEHIEHLNDIGEIRDNFMQISNAIIVIAEEFDPITTTIYVQHCPMADSNNGADWLSQEEEILNPYFGAAMLGCGETTKTLK